MSWWHEKREYQSEKNCSIHCTRWFGRWRVTVGGYGQTTPYTNAMWRRALRRVPRRGVKRVLMLGLGAGGAIPLLHRRFNNPAITVIEWDPVMVRIAEELVLFSPRERSTILLGDAVELVRNFSERFDLVVIDLFCGKTVMPSLDVVSFVESVARVVAQNGYVIMNAFMEPEIFTVFDHLLSCHAMWRFRYNHLALFRPLGCGKAGDLLPNGYRHFKQSSLYLEGDRDPRSSVCLIGQPGCFGMRWRHGPLWFEGYETDVEPLIINGPRRMIIWQPLTRRDRPPGWHRSFIQMNFRRTGFADITNVERYWESWTPHAQRHRRRWLRDTRYQIEEVDIDSFVDGYIRVPKLRGFLKREFIKIVRNRKAFHGEALHLFGVRERSSGALVAGLAVLDLQDALHSNHVISYVHPDAESSSAGTGLIDHWFQHCSARGIRFLNFGVFWTFGDPWSWRGFSKFKSQFGIHYIHRPNPLVKFVRKSS